MGRGGRRGISLGDGVVGDRGLGCGVLDDRSVSRDGFGSGSLRDTLDTSLVDFDRVYLPVGLLEGSRVVGNVIFAACGGVGAGQGTARVAEDTTSPVTTEGDVEYERLLFEAVGDVAAILNQGHWSTELANIRLATGDRGRDLGAREVPNFDVCVGPLHRIDTTTLLVERGTIASFLALNNTADCTEVLTATRGVDAASHSGVSDTAGTSGVHDDLVVVLEINTFDNINLTVSRPVLAD